MIEHRPAERRMEHPIAQGKLFRQPPVSGIGQIVVAHHQAAGIGDDGELVHLAAVDLHLLLIEAVDQITGGLACRNVGVDRERRIRQVRGKARVGGDRPHCRVYHRRQRLVDVSFGVDLTRGLPGVAQPLRPRKHAEHVVEAAVFLEDDDDVTDFGQRIIRRKRGSDRVRGSEPGEDNASHCESTKRMRVHAELARVLLTATIGISDRDGNDWSVTFPRQNLVLHPALEEWSAQLSELRELFSAGLANIERVGRPHRCLATDEHRKIIADLTLRVSAGRCSLVVGSARLSYAAINCVKIRSRITRSATCSLAQTMTKRSVHFSRMIVCFASGRFPRCSGTLHAWRRVGKPSAFIRLGRAVRYRLSDLHELIRRGYAKRPGDGQDAS